MNTMPPPAGSPTPAATHIRVGGAVTRASVRALRARVERESAQRPGFPVVVDLSLVRHFDPAGVLGIVEMALDATSNDSRPRIVAESRPNRDPAASGDAGWGGPSPGRSALPRFRRSRPSQEDMR